MQVSDKRQYIIEVGTQDSQSTQNNVDAHQLIKNLQVNQTPEEKVLSNDHSMVVTLDNAQVDKLREKYTGIKIGENKPMSVPEKESYKVVSDETVSVKTNISIKGNGAEKLHQMGITGKGVTSVIVDTGVFPHKDLKVAGYANMFDPNATEPSDPHGHGTHCSGIANGCAPEGSGGVIGMAPDAELWGVQVLDNNGSGSYQSVRNGVEYAIKLFEEGHKPMVVSMSLGGPPDSTSLLKDTILRAKNMGIEFAIAAGNEGPRPDTIGHPGDVIGITTVAADDDKNTVTMDDDRIVYFSSRGGEKYPHKPDISASGTNVLSTLPDNKYASWSGTSMATPHVAGGKELLMSAALMLKEKGMLKEGVSILNDGSEKEFIDYTKLLYDTAIDRSSEPSTNEGHGMMRVDAAYELLVKLYGKEGAFVEASDFEKLFDQKAVRGFDGKVNHEESAKEYYELAQAEFKMAKELDKLEAVKNSETNTKQMRRIAIAADILEAPVKALKGLNFLVHAKIHEAQAKKDN